MVTIKEGDLFNAKGLICHQVNCKGNMGRGVARTFRLIFPVAYQNYLNLCHEVDDSKQLLGACLFCKEETGESCCMFAQNDWRGKNVCNTDYSAFRACCKKLAERAKSFNQNCVINMPYLIGCGLGGGDWDIVKDIIEQELSNYEVILWKLK